MYEMPVDHPYGGRRGESRRTLTGHPIDLKTRKAITWIGSAASLLDDLTKTYPIKTWSQKQKQDLANYMAKLKPHWESL